MKWWRGKVEEWRRYKAWGGGVEVERRGGGADRAHPSWQPCVPPPLAVVAAVLSSCTAEAAALVAELAFECSAPSSSVDDTIWI